MSTKGICDKCGSKAKIYNCDSCGKSICKHCLKKTMMRDYKCPFCEAHIKK